MSKEDNCAHKIDPPNELEINRAFTRKLDNVFCVLKAISKFKSLVSNRRETPPTVQEEIEEGNFDPAEEKARAEEIEQLLAQRREVLKSKAAGSGDSNGEFGDGEGKGHAKDIGDQEPLYLGIGTSSKHAFYIDEEEDDIVADSPSAVDYNIYDRAYEQAIKDRLAENPSSRPIMYLTKFVKETDHFKAFENIVEGTMFSPTAVKEQMRETRENLYEHFNSPSTTKLAKLVAKIGLSDPPQGAKPTGLGADGLTESAASEASGIAEAVKEPKTEESGKDVSNVEEPGTEAGEPGSDKAQSKTASGRQTMKLAIEALTSKKPTSS